MKRFLRPWAVPIPALLSCTLALLTRDTLWIPRVMSTRSAQGTLGTPAHAAIALIAFVLIAYYASFHRSMHELLTSGGRMRQPVSEQEMGCAIVLLRVLLMGVLYWLAVRMWGRV